MTTRATRYQEIFKMAEAIVEGENDIISNMANICALLHELNFLWTGFYRVDHESEQLVLGPFQGPVACSRIPYGKGVCGTAWKNKSTVIVPDVHQFPGHIACSSQSNSEIVVPVFKGCEVTAVLDIDSTEFGTFDDIDKEWLERIVSLI